jgi:hypothetical protein
VKRWARWPKRSSRRPSPRRSRGGGRFDIVERSPNDRRLLPADIRQRILALKAEYPAFRPHEIAEICRRRDDCRVSHKTVQRVLDTYPLPTDVRRRYPPYAQMAAGQQRRLAIVPSAWNVSRELRRRRRSEPGG